MSRKKTLHGRAVSAPDETGFAAGESPTPPEARARGSQEETAGGGVGGWQRAWSVVKLLWGVLIVVGATSAVAWGAHRYALTTPRFAITAIEVDGARRLGEGQLSKLMGVEAGDNIFAVDTAAAERKLLASPWVEEVKITRELPSTLQVALTERDAAAVVVLGDALYLTTRRGEPFKRLEDGDPYDLPVVTGVDMSNLARDRAREVERIGLALEVLRHYRRIPVSRIYPAQELHVTAGGDVILTAGKDGMTLHLGSGPWRKKLLMAARVIGKLGAKGKVPGVIFLDNQAHPERVVVRMR